MPGAYNHISAAALFLWSKSSARNSDSLQESSLRLTVRRALRVGGLVPLDEKADQQRFSFLSTTGRVSLYSVVVTVTGQKSQTI